MFSNLQELGIGVIGFALIVGVGLIILVGMEGGIGNCPSVDGNTTSWNMTLGKCNFDNGNGSVLDAEGVGAVNLRAMQDELGSDGLAGWTPAVIALVVGLMFLGAFVFKGKRTI